MDQFPPWTQRDHGCLAPGQLQLQVLVLHLPGELQNCFCFPAVKYLQEERGLEEKPCAETLEAPFAGEDGVE